MMDRAGHVARGKGRSLWIAGDLVTFKLVGEDTGGAFVLGEEITRPGSGPPPHIHHREDETFYVLEGEYEFLIGGSRFRAVAGSIVYGPKDVPHTFENVGTEPGRMLALVTPAGVEGFFEEAGQEATDASSPPPFGREEIERLLVAAPRYGIEMLPPGQRAFSPENYPRMQGGRVP